MYLKYKHWLTFILVGVVCGLIYSLNFSELERHNYISLLLSSLIFSVVFFYTLGLIVSLLSNIYQKSALKPFIDKRKKTPGRNILVLFAVFVLFYLIHTKIKFTVNAFNFFFDAALFCIPSLILLNILWIKRTWIKWPAFFLWLMPTLLFSCFAMLTFLGGFSAHAIEEPIHTFAVENRRVVAYRTNYQGALGGFGLLIRVEQTIFPGIMIVKNEFYSHDCYDVRFEKIDKKTVKVIDSEGCDYNGYDYFVL